MPCASGFCQSDSLKHIFCYLSLQIIYKYAKSLTALAAPSLVIVVPDEQAHASEGQQELKDYDINVNHDDNVLKS